MARCRVILRLCLLEDVICTGFCMLIVFLFGDRLIALINDDSEVIRLGYIRASIVFCAYIFSLSYDVMSGYLRGFGISFLPSLLTILGVCGVRFLWVAFVFPVYHDLPIIGMIIFLFLGLALGSNVVIAQSIGRRDTEGVKKAVHTAVLLSLIIGIAVAVFAQFAVVPILGLLEIPAEVLPSAVMYLRIYFLGMPIILLYNFEAAIFRSIGETQKPLMALIAASLVNIVLDLFFVCVCKLDVTGVAIATVLANAVSALILLRLLLKTDSIIKLEWNKLHLDMPTLKEIVSIGLPAGIQGAVFSLANVVIQGAINSLGTEVIAASSASLILEMVAFSIFSSFTQACTTFVGQNYGARQMARCRVILRLCLLEDVICTGFCMLIGQTFVMHKFSYAAHAVTAHLAFAAVSVEHTHFEVSNVRFANADKTVTANTKASMTYIFGNSARVRQHLLGAVYIDIIITSTMHFCKFYFHGPSSFESSLLIITKIY
jgi:putative MATE family efflux protein